MAKLPDFITAENELDGQEHVYIAQGGKTRKTLLQKIKEFVIGTATMGTTATDITGAIAEHTSQLNDITNSGYLDISKDAKGVDYKTIKSNGFYRNVTGTPTVGTSGVLQVMANTDKWSIVYKWSTISNAVITEYISCKDGDNYSQWKQISNNQNKEIELPLNSPYLEYAGVSAGYSNKIIRKDNGTIIISFCVKKADGSRIAANELIGIANIPVGYRIKACFGSASIWGGFKPSLAYIDGSHTLTCRAVEEGEAIVGNIIGEAI